MLNLKSIITVLAIATASTIASASPSISVNASASWSSYRQPAPAPVVRDHRTPTQVLEDDCATPVVQPVTYQPGNRWEPRQPVFAINNVKITSAHASDYTGPLASIGNRASGLIALTAPTRLETDREDFYIWGQGKFHTLQLRANAGSTLVKQVTIEFMDDTAQVIQLQRTLDSRTAPISITVNNQDHRQIKRIFVYGQGSNNSAYQIFAA